MRTPFAISRTARLLGATLALALMAAPAHAADAPFTPRFAQTAHGDIAAVGNTVLTCPTATAGCTQRAERHRRHAEQQQLEHDAGQRGRRHRQLVVGHGRASRRRDGPMGGPVLGRRHERRHERRRGTERRRQGHGQAARSPAAPTSRSPPPPADVLTSSLQATRYRAFRDVTALVDDRRHRHLLGRRHPGRHRPGPLRRLGADRRLPRQRAADPAPERLRRARHGRLGAHLLDGHRALPHARHRHRDHQGRAALLRGRREPRHGDGEVQRPCRSPTR